MAWVSLPKQEFLSKDCQIKHTYVFGFIKRFRYLACEDSIYGTYNNKYNGVAKSYHV
jgi:hypothetical protein